MVGSTLGTCLTILSYSVREVPYLTLTLTITLS